MTHAASNHDTTGTIATPLAELRPLTASFASHASSVDEWANTVTITTCEGYDPADITQDDNEAAADCADSFGARQLIEIDTNYKPTRTSEHPVRLTRTDATRLVAAVLHAIEDTFHYSRVGRLRPADAAELLTSLDDIDYALAELRSHVLTDLLLGTGLDPDSTSMSRQ